MKALRSAGLLAALVLPLMAWPAHAQGGTAADCSITVRVRFSPGVSLTPTSGVEATGGETGLISCSGTFDGHRVTGPGSFGYEGMFTRITCLSDRAPLSGTYSMTIPTDAGSLHFTGAIADARIAAIDHFTLTQPGGRFGGIAVIVPTMGDCFVTPLTEILIYMAGSFTS
jgi:hypothetical protein